MVRVALKKTFKQKRTGSKKILARIAPMNSKRWTGEIRGQFDTTGDAMNWIMNIIAIELINPVKTDAILLSDGEIFKAEIVKPTGHTEQYVFTKTKE